MRTASSQSCLGKLTQKGDRVYLVREVLYDPDPADDDLLTPLDPEEWTRPKMFNRSWSQDPFSMMMPTSPTYGRNFALKCLCKQDLTAELIEVQRGEAHLHRALPDHENIVRLFAVRLDHSHLERAYADNHSIGVRDGRLVLLGS